MRLIFVNRFYWPELPATGQLLADLAEAMAKRGHEVHVITSHSGEAGLPRRDLHAGVQIHRVRSRRSTTGSVPGKAMDFLAFYLGALWRLWREARRGNVIVALTDPPLLGIGAWLVAVARGARLVHWVQDIYPEVAIELAGQSWLRLVRPLRNLAWRRAARCVTLGSDMAARLTRAGVEPARIAVVPNWAPAGLATADAAGSAALRHTWGLEGKFVIAYSGNLGRVHDLDPVLAVAQALRDDTGIAFVFIGGGPQRPALEASAQRLGLANVRFVPAQPRAQLAAALGTGDLHLVTLRPGCEALVFPSKLYGIVAVHRPVLFIGPRDCEIARTVRDHGLGQAFHGSDVTGIAAGIRRMAGDPAERARYAQPAAEFARAHDAGTATARWSAILETVQAC
ncbi:MAG TPA: glycosyltransferase family 4 protein [Opitutaceae bacterium]|nr:glycosyltransferase family 4 protein [Opitutaceae bacterium]